VILEVTAKYTRKLVRVIITHHPEPVLSPTIHGGSHNIGGVYMLDVTLTYSNLSFYPSCLIFTARYSDFAPYNDRSTTLPKVWIDEEEALATGLTAEDYYSNSMSRDIGLHFRMDLLPF